jgi:DNA-binding transcriptional regulator YdaS (Cro superfamily)
MHEILQYLRTLPVEERDAFAARCKTTVGYLRKAVSVKQQLGVELCVNLERESGGALRCERLFPGLDWEYLRRSALVNEASGGQELADSDQNQPSALTQQARGAINSEATEVA